MATDNGTIIDSTAGIIDRNIDSTGMPGVSRGPINYATNSFRAANGFTNGTQVSFTIYIDPATGAVSAINLTFFEPADEGTVYDAAHPIAGTLQVGAGQTVTLSGTSVGGQVTVNAAKIIIKSHNNMRTTLGRGLNARGGATVVFYNSEIQGTVVVNNCQKFSASKGNLRSTVVSNNNTVSVSFDAVMIDDSLVATNNASVSVTNCTIAGDLVLNHNTACSSPAGSNTVTGENLGCQP